MIHAKPDWTLYLIRTANGSLYTGITTDVERRFAEHDRNDDSDTEFSPGQAYKGAKALRGKGPLQLVFKKTVGNRSEALKMEYRVKQLCKADKESLVAGRLSLEWLTD